eukprot:1343464-Pleurochrysis_carterae.AAC.1
MDLDIEAVGPCPQDKEGKDGEQKHPAACKPRLGCLRGAASARLYTEKKQLMRAILNAVFMMTCSAVQLIAATLRSEGSGRCRGYT